MVEIVSAAAQGEMRRWYPFGPAVFAFSGSPTAGFDGAVVCRTGKGEPVDIGVAAVGPFVDVVDFGEVARNVTTGRGAASLEGV